MLKLMWEETATGLNGIYNADTHELLRYIKDEVVFKPNTARFYLSRDTICGEVKNNAKPFIQQVIQHYEKHGMLFNGIAKTVGIFLNDPPTETAKLLTEIA